jgi:site-specific recombinase XerD
MQNTSIQAYQFSLDSAIAGWITQKETMGGSHPVMVDGRLRTRTGIEYERTMKSFRQYLTGAPGFLDVLPLTAQSEEDVTHHAIAIAGIAPLWANTRAPARKRKDDKDSARFDSEAPVSASMVNQRLAVISSFYTFVQDTYKLHIPNPIKDVKRKKVQPYADAAANAIPPDEIEQGLDSIDRSTQEGLRDYALLAVALYTGRRASELADLRGQDVKLQGRASNMRILLTFRAKGDKKMHDLLDPDTSAVLLDYLHARFGKHLQTVQPDAPIWISYSRNATRGQAISIRTLSNIVAAHLPTSKVHATRHSFVVAMLRSGAPLTDVADHLGHTDIKITRIYAKELLIAENQYGEQLVKRFGIKRKAK